MLRVDDKIDPLSMSEAASIRQLDYHTLKQDQVGRRGDVIERELGYLSDVWRRVGNGKFVLFPDSAAFAKSYIGKPGDNKVRPVWAIPLSIVLQEARFAVPLTQQFIDQKCCRNTGYGCEMMKGGMMWLNGQIAQLNCKYGQTKILMIDYTSFDATVPAWLIRDVFYVIMEKFNLTKRDRICVKKCIKYIINTPIQNSDGRRFKKDHGIPSGSMFANIIGCLVNMVVTWYTSKIVMGEYPVMDMFFGDDEIACFRGSVLMDLTNYAKAVQHFFGMKINSKKTYWTSNQINVHFLGYFNYYGTPYKNAEELIAAMLFPQYLVDEWEYCISRSPGCLLASAGASMDVFMACQAVYKKACLAGVDVEKAISLIKENPRNLRHLITMGVQDLVLSENFFYDIKLSIPFSNCSRFTEGVQLWCE